MGENGIFCLMLMVFLMLGGIRILKSLDWDLVFVFMGRITTGSYGWRKQCILVGQDSAL